jgi:hypothetical protein
MPEDFVPGQTDGQAYQHIAGFSSFLLSQATFKGMMTRVVKDNPRQFN